jgi:hypothetical protein
MRERLRADLLGLAELDAVHVVGGPITLLAKANPAILTDAHARHWIGHGRLAPDFAAPSRVERQPTANRRLGTFHIVGFGNRTAA